MAKNIITLTRTEELNRYFEDVRKYSVLSYDEERAVVAKMVNGDESARETLINANLRYVISEAKKYSNDPTKLRDLIQEGNIGLIKAAAKFDLSRETKFITYAVFYIRESIRESLYKNAFIYRPSDRILAAQVIKITEDFLKKNERTPSESEIRDILEANGTHVSPDVDLSLITFSYLDNPVSDEEEGACEGEIGEVAMTTASANTYDAECDKEENEHQVSSLLKALNAREREVISLSFGLTPKGEMCDEAIAEDLCISAERVRQIKKAAIAKMQKRASALASMTA